MERRYYSKPPSSPAIASLLFASLLVTRTHTPLFPGDPKIPRSHPWFFHGPGYTFPGCVLFPQLLDDSALSELRQAFEETLHGRVPGTKHLNGSVEEREEQSASRSEVCRSRFILAPESLE